MFKNIISRIRSWVARGPGPEAPPVPPTSSQPPAPAEEASDPTAEAADALLGPVVAVPDDPDVSEAIWHEVRTRVEELRSRFGGADHPEVEALLDGICRPGAVIRQPPVAAQAVLSLSRRRNYGLDEMTSHFERDPAMSQALLRHSNSAWYAGLSEQSIISIKAAIQRVGTKGVHATVMYHLLQGELSRPGGDLEEMARMVWEHSVRTAPLARGVARFFRADPEEAFTLGLLHDVGKLVFFDRVAVERKRLRRDVPMPDGFVNAALNMLHEPLGGLAALEWGLDPRSAQVIATHHRRGDHPREEPLSQVVYLAEAVDVAQQRGVGVDVDHLWEVGGLEGPLDAVDCWLADEMASVYEAEREHRRKQALTR